MGNRLLDWFSVVMAEAKRRRTHNKGKGTVFFSLQCSKHQSVSGEKHTSYTSSSYVSLQAEISKMQENASYIAGYSLLFTKVMHGKFKCNSLCPCL